ncbi:MarR family winged helix-turn-helix transcriptional regulator [Streptomyces paludis]|uniref:MarR family transcriptional regulator n=1 Tax=Streptomyces paludis TaxID=2282738 RepID=A0A345HZJ4_9ACTN|nr:MarR family transcriptional regulator [Streptomyces paludis]AXG82118.1 MarR family transcriptional regulator [Streptomyces paludis]
MPDTAGSAVPDAAPDATAPQGAVAKLEMTLASLAYLLTRARAHDERISRAGVSARRSDVHLLLALDAHDGVGRVGDLADRLMVEPSHVTRQIARLQSQGLVERTADPLDGRARRVAITEAGTALLTRLRHANRAAIQRALTGFDEADIATAAAVLQRLMDGYARQVEATGPQFTD